MISIVKKKRRKGRGLAEKNRVSRETANQPNFHFGLRYLAITYSLEPLPLSSILMCVFFFFQ